MAHDCTLAVFALMLKIFGIEHTTQYIACSMQHTVYTTIYHLLFKMVLVSFKTHFIHRVIIYITYILYNIYLIYTLYNMILASEGRCHMCANAECTISCAWHYTNYILWYIYIYIYIYYIICVHLNHISIIYHCYAFSEGVDYII